MHKYCLPLAVLVCSVSSCESPTPNDYFGRTVLNLNFFRGFADGMMEGQLKQPSMKLSDGAGSEVVPMTRKEVVDDKIQFAEDSFGKVKRLKETDETRALIRASKAVYEYIIPVYRGEYQELARLYDTEAPQAEIDALSQSIREKYGAGYQQRMDAVLAAAKPYAEKNGLRVNWDVGGGPRR